MGKFTYDPPAGFEGNDTFITRSAVSMAAAVTQLPSHSHQRHGLVHQQPGWCVVAGCGRLSNPFSTLAAFNTLNNGTGNNPAANNNIFIFTGSGNYTGPLTLLNGQRVIGQGAT